MRKTIAFVLLCAILLTVPVNAYAPIPRSMDPEKIVAAAVKYSSDSYGNCAYFVSKCLRAGGFRYLYEEGCTQIHNALMKRKNVVRFHQALDGTEYVMVDESFRDVLAPGDVVMYYCWYCNLEQNGPYLHSLIYMGVDQEGRMLGYSHNPWETPESAYTYLTHCYEKGCRATLRDIYFYHFIMTEEYEPGKLCFLGARGNTEKSYFFDKNVLTCQDSEGRILARGRKAQCMLPVKMQICFYQ